MTKTILRGILQFKKMLSDFPGICQSVSACFRYSTNQQLFEHFSVHFCGLPRPDPMFFALTLTRKYSQNLGDRMKSKLEKCVQRKHHKNEHVWLIKLLIHQKTLVRSVPISRWSDQILPELKKLEIDFTGDLIFAIIPRFSAFASILKRCFVFFVFVFWMCWILEPVSHRVTFSFLFASTLVCYLNPPPTDFPNLLWKNSGARLQNLSQPTVFWYDWFPVVTHQSETTEGSSRIRFDELHKVIRILH